MSDKSQKDNITLVGATEFTQKYPHYAQSIHVVCRCGFETDNFREWLEHIQPGLKIAPESNLLHTRDIGKKKEGQS